MLYLMDWLNFSKEMFENQKENFDCIKKEIIDHYTELDEKIKKISRIPKMLQEKRNEYNVEEANIALKEFTREKDLWGSDCGYGPLTYRRVE
jgi:hypothetical protein